MGYSGDKVNELLEASSSFMIGDREFTFDESESIFFMTEAIDPSNYTNTASGCNTCGEKWRRQSDLSGSHCHFCGVSNCKKCLTKTKFFKDNPNKPIELNQSGR